ncbi:MAG: HD-GYP domain-containing protein [Gammaproteobacteria bacterium]|nr:HD-GYP domain-containing protein [Gammaproteobacteria bacterium]
MKKRIPASSVTKGMYVSELDRPWLESPFLFQGFKVSTDDELERLRALCKYVYIDIEEGLDLQPSDPLGPWHIKPRERISEEADEHAIMREIHEESDKLPSHPLKYPDRATFEEELDAAREVEIKTKNVIYSIMEDVRLGKSIDTKGAKQVVHDVTESIIRNPDALICLTQLKNKDEYTALHSLRVCILSLAFGRHLGFDKDLLNILGLGALLHDVGKMKIPNEVLNKPEGLTEEEFAIIKSHVPLGVEILEQHKSGIPDVAIDVARYHHERFDGSGYASGKKGPEISQFGLIGSITDCYDAITSDRAYHEGMSSHDALKRMYEWRFKDFEPKLIEQFIQCMGIYPIGSLVEMSTGAIGVVVTINRARRLRPKVVLVMTPELKPYSTGTVIDLMNQPVEFSSNSLSITKVLPSGTHNINPSDYLPLHGHGF